MPPRRTPTPARRGPKTARRGILLLVVLAIIAVMALISAGLLYRMDAERMGTQALNDLQQARAAAESGLSRALLLLRDNRIDMDEWWNNYEIFRRILVWAPDQEGGSTSLADQEVVEGRPAWRFSILGYEREQGNEQEVSIRYGLTPESGKININTATRGQLLRLFDQFQFENVTSEELADALIDWRDADNDLNSPNGAESAYYMTRRPSYRAKNRPFDTVEELLLVRGFTGRILYGEDYNRNGYLDENEDDGPEGAFPFDNGDGILDRGVYPFLTVYSWDWNFANDNKPRYDINALNWSEPDKLPKPIVEELSGAVIDFLAEAKGRGFKFRSVGELWQLEVYEDGSTNYDAAWELYNQQRGLENKVETDEEEMDEEEEQQGPDDEGEMDEDEMDEGGDEGDVDEGDDIDAGNEDDDRRSTARDRREARDRRNNRDDEQDPDEEDPDAVDKSERLRQSVRDAEPGQEGEPNESDSRRRTASDRRAERERRLQEARERARGGNRAGGDEDRGGPTGGETGGDETGGGRQDKDPGIPVTSPATAQDMDVAMDRLTVYNPAKYPALPGHINVNTAEPEVLRTILGLTEEDVNGIVARRSQMTGQDKLTPAWLGTTGAVVPERFAVTCNQLTTRAIQFTVDVVGFADHVGTARRLQVVVEMRGHMAQIRYYRDITSLGIGYPVKDDERSEGFAFTAGQ